jgi:predicted ABC-type ATPase
MPLDTYRSLPLRTLYELVAIAARDLSAAVDSKEDREIALKAMQKQVEILLQIIDEKKREAAETASSKITPRDPTGI